MKQKPWCYLKLSSRGPSKLQVKIDREDLARLSQHSWRATRGTTGRLRVVTSIRTAAGSRSITLGRFLMKPSKSKQVYPRRFSEELDYRKENLVVCTLQERQRLLPKKKSETTSAYRGVSSTASGSWRAGIEVDGQSMNLGTFESEHEAALVYNKASKKYFGAMGYQNRIEKKRVRKS